MCHRIRSALALVVCAVFGSIVSPAQDVPAAPAVDPAAEGPAELLETGRAAFEAKDFATAEEKLEKFIVDYGEAEEAKEAARLHTPLVAICKVALKKFGEAIEWIEKARVDPELDPAFADELSFWRGICLTTQGELVDAQHAFGEYWADESHQPFKRYEALLMFATLYLQQGFPAEAADFLAGQLPKFREIAPEAASRAVVLQLHARMEAEQHAEALALVRAEYPNLAEMTQVISFQTMALRLGSALLDQENHHDAISCFQRIWTTEKLLEYQNAQLQRIDDRIKVVAARENSGGAVFQLEAIRKRVERELEGFRKIENFDSALRLRLAMAFQGLGRYREAALVMEEMLATMPPDSIVESATLAQLQCWMEIGRWPKAVETAERYERVFGAEGKHLPTVLFLKAEALREDQLHGAAQLAYGDVVERFPASEFAPKATFLQGFLYLQQDDNEGALYQFAQLKRNYPDDGLVEDADYWTGMAHSFSGLYDEARQHLGGYLERWETPKYGKEATFRIAVCTFSLAEYDEALTRLQDFVAEYPDDPLADEANLLIGDAHLGEGRVEKGLAAYDLVRPESGRFFEEAWFKKGEVFKQLEEFGTMREHFATFVSDHPKSRRMPEAIYWIGWTHAIEGETDKAKQIYWETIEAHGNDPAMTSIIDVFLGLPKAYAPDGPEGRTELLARIERTKSLAAIRKDALLASRAGWAKAQFLAKENPVASRTELMDIAKWVDPKENAPSVSVPVAEALLEAGNRLTAKELLIEIRKWHPRAVEKGRIYRALGQIAAAEDDPEKAIEYLDRFERYAIASTDLAEVKLEKARMLAGLGKDEQARGEFEAILDLPAATAASKAEALFRLGESHAAAGAHGKAIVFFERVYVAYGKFAELNAKAYVGRAESLEEMDLLREALETLEEFVARPELAKFDGVAEAKEDIVRLRVLAPPDPEPTAAEEEGAGT